MHTGEGTHWVAMFIHISPDNPTIEFYNSFGKNPPEAIMRYINKAATEIQEVTGKKVVLLISNKRHQYENRECGMYSLHFIIDRVDGMSANEIMTTSRPDASMQRTRPLLFDATAT